MDNRSDGSVESLPFIWKIAIFLLLLALFFSVLALGPPV